MSKAIIWDQTSQGNPQRAAQAGDTVETLTQDLDIKNSAFTVLANYSYSLSTQSGSLTLELPDTADEQAIIKFTDVYGLAAENHVIFQNSSNDVLGILNANLGTIQFRYCNDLVQKWVIDYQSVPYDTVSNYEALYVNPTYGNDTTGNGTIENPFETVQACINSFTAGSPRVIYVLGSTTANITFRSGDQSMRIVFDPKTSHTGTITLVSGNTSIYFDSLDGSAILSGTINDASAGNIYYNTLVTGTYNKTGGSGALAASGYVQFSENSNIDAMIFNLTGNSQIRTLGTGNMGLLTMSNGVFNARHKGTMFCPVVSSPANPLLGVPVLLLQSINLLNNGGRCLDARNLTFGQVFLENVSAYQSNQTLSIIDFTGASTTNVVLTIWGSCQLAKSGNVLPTLTTYANDSNNIDANYTNPPSYVPTNTTIRGHLQGISDSLPGIPISSSTDITSSQTDTVYTATKTYRITNTGASSITFTCTGTRTFANTSFGNSSTVLTIPPNAIAVITVLSATSMLIRDLSSFLGFAAQYLKYSRTTAQSGLADNTQILFDTPEAIIGSNISINTGTGTITLQPGYTYRLRAGVTFVTSSGSPANLQYMWRNNTTSTLIGNKTWNLATSFTTNNGVYMGTAEAVITPTVATQVSVIVTNLSDVASINAAISPAWCEVQAISSSTPINTLTYSGSIISSLANGTALGTSSASPLTIMSVNLPVAGTYQITGYMPYLSTSTAKVLLALSIGGTLVANSTCTGQSFNQAGLTTESFVANTWQVTVGTANTVVSIVQWSNNGTASGTLYNNASNGFAQMTYELISVPPQMSYSSFVTKASALVNTNVEVVLGNLRARIPTSGNKSLQIATVSGTYSVYGSCTFVNNANLGGARIDSGSPLNVTTTFAYLNSANNFGFAGDMCIWLIMDTANNISWRLSFIIGAGNNNNMISIEQLV